MNEAGNFTMFPVPGTNGALRITTGPDGNLWFTQPFDNIVGRITISGVVTQFTLAIANSQPRDIVAGPDGNLYFTEPPLSELAQITPNGVVMQVQTIRPSDSPWGLGRDAGTGIWLTQISGNKVSRFSVGSH